MNNLFVNNNFSRSFLVAFLILNLALFQGTFALAEQTQPINSALVSESVFAQQNQAPTYLYPVADAYVYAYAYRNWNRSNRGKYEQLVAGWNPVGGESRAYVRFDLNGVSPSSVHRAVLRLYHTGTYGNNGVKLGIYRVSDPWIEGWDTYHSGQVEKTAAPGVLSWVQQPVYNSSIMASFNPGTGQGNYVEIDVTTLVREWLAGFQNNGLLIKPAGNMNGSVSESVYHFASREVADKDHWPVLILNGPPASSSITSKPTAINQIGAATSLNLMRWQPHKNGEGQYSIGSDQICMNSMNPGGVWFTKRRPYNFKNDYSVEFNFKLNTNNNHWTVLYSDGFVYVHIDWGTTFAWYQPGASWGEKTSNSLATNRWYKLRVNAKPSQNKFDIYLDNNLLGTATNVKPFHSYHTLPSQINDQNIIWFGDPDSKADRGGSYNRGNVCWKNIVFSGVSNNTTPNNGSTYNAWVVNSSHNLYKWNGHDWNLMTGNARGDIGVGADGSVWVAGPHIYKWMGKYWNKFPGDAERVDVDPNGLPWILNKSGDIYRWENNNWHKMPGRATDIGIGANGDVWIIGTDVINSNHGIYKWNGTQWVKHPGAAVRIDVGPNGTPWVVNAAGDIYKFTNNSWHQLPGKAKDISVGADGTPWVIGTDNTLGGHGIYRWNGSNWARIPGGAIAISVGGLTIGKNPKPVFNKYANAVAKPCGSDKEFIRSLYQSILDRNPKVDISLEPGHGAAHLRDLQNGIPRWRIIWNFFNSPEYKAKNKSEKEFMRDVYQSILGRNPNSGDILMQKFPDRNKEIKMFIDSQEYKQIMTNCSNKNTGGFGTSKYNEFSLKGDIYFLKPNTSRLPDFSKMTPVGTIYTKELNVSHRSFTDGFPGVTNRFEWFGIRYTGAFQILSGGKYKFRLVSDDGAKLWIDNKLIIDNDGLQSFTSKSGSVYLNSGLHNIRVDYFQGPKTMLGLQLFITPPGGTEKIFSPKYASNQTTNTFKNALGKPYGSAPDISGTWKWFNGVIVTIDQYGNVSGSNGGKGTLKVNTNNNNIEYVIKWTNGYTDWLKLNGNTLKGKNQNGTAVWAKKIIPIKKAGGNTVQHTTTVPKLFNHNIVGQWKWHSGTVVSIYPNGKVKSSDGNYGTWTTGNSTDVFVIHWIKGHNVDRLSLKGDNLKGKNQNGLKLSAKKIVVDFKSGKYRVEQYTGSTYKSEWKIQVKKNKITGKSEWTCCPGRRTDPVKGYINGYTVVIERDCSGQNWSGACRQKFVGTLMGTKIEGTCTGTGIVGTGRWVLFLK